MGVFQKLGLTPSSALLNPSAISSPWTEGALNSIVWADIFGEDMPRPVSRAEAMAVPALARARNLICTVTSRLPLEALEGPNALPKATQPTWLYRTDGQISPQLRTLWTIDDLLFYGASLWAVERGTEGQVLAADRVPMDEWEIDADGRILVNGGQVDARSVIYFPSFVEGILLNGASAIKGARSVQASVARRAAAPVPVMEIHHEDPESPLTKPEAEALVKAYNAARRDPEGATVFTPSHIKLNALGANADSGALVEARNAARLDVANLTGVPASLLEGSSAGASLTYVTTEGKRSEFLDYGVTPWLDVISWRLSMDDVVPRGQRVRFNMSELLNTLPSATGAETQD